MTVRVIRLLGFSTLAALAMGVAIYATQYLTKPPSAFPFVVQRDVFATERVALSVHVSFGALALVVGPLQFVAFVRRKIRVAHRALGSIYVSCVLLAAAAGLWLAPHSHGAPVSSAGFAALGALWATATVMAVIQARRGDFAAHRAWMIRSYAMTFAAVTLRAEFGLLIYVGGLDVEQAYQIAAWSSWSLNLILAEWALVGSEMRARPGARS